MIELNSQQQQVVESVLGQYICTIKRRDRSIVRLSGKGGVGKTAVTSYLLSQIFSMFNPEKVAISCLAHRALDNFKVNLEKIFPEYKQYMKNNILQFRTIASLLRKFPIGYNKFSASNNESIKDFDLIVIDEYSMIGKPDTKTIIEGMKAGSMVIFLGDGKQLPPVMSPKSDITLANETDTRIYGLPLCCLELTQQMRNPGAIGEFCDKSREEVIYPTKESTKDNDSIVVHSDVEQLVNTACEYIKKYGTEDVCVFNYTNKACFEIGDRIRQTLFPGKEDLCEGEIVTVTRGDSNIRTGDVFQLGGISKRTVRKLGIYKVWSKKHRDYVEVIHKKQEPRLARFITALEEKVKEYKGSDIYIYKTMLNKYKSVLVVSYQYCSTIHSGQGKSIPYCFVNTIDLQKCRGGKKNLLYVGYSRSSKELHTVEVN